MWSDSLSDMLPPHLPYMVYNMFQTSSCQKFNNFFASLYAHEQADLALEGKGQQLDVEMLFQIAEQQYRTYLEEGIWATKNKRGSGFMAGVICWFCHQEGHLYINSVLYLRCRYSISIVLE